MSEISPAALHPLGGEGPPVLLLHGFGADRFGWAANAHALMRTHAVWAAELPGHGASGDAVGDGAPATLARGVLAALDERPAPLLAPLPVVAHSLGAAVALHLAQLRPDSFSALVLIAPAGLGGPIDRDFLATYPTLSSDAEVQALLSRLVARPALIAPAMIAHVLAGLREAGRRAALARIAAALPEAPPPPAPPDGSRVTFVWGEGDRIVPPPVAPPFGRVPHRIAHVGHLAHLEAAGAVNRLVAAALG